MCTVMHACGATHRQQEPNLQRKLDPRRQHARCLGHAEQHLRLGHGPQERTSADRQQRPEQH